MRGLRLRREGCRHAEMETQVCTAATWHGRVTRTRYTIIRVK